MSAVLLAIALVLSFSVDASSEPSIVGEWLVFENVSDQIYVMSFETNSTVRTTIRDEKHSGKYDFTNEGAYGKLSLVWADGSDSQIWVQYFNDRSLVFYQSHQEAAPDFESAQKMSRLRRKEEFFWLQSYLTIH